MFGWVGANVTLYVIGTAHFRKDYSDIVGQARFSGIKIIDQSFPRNVIVMPSMEIVHDYADRLGISPEWRYQGPEQDLDGVSEPG